MLDTRLADRIRAKGVAVEEVAGWQTRGRPAAYQPRGAVNHHTAGARSGLTPSLATVLYGRSDVPGPLAQVLQSREADPSTDKAYVVAAGTANHAGAGGWNGLTGNTSVGGLEVEHHGTGPVPQERLEISARIIAALLEAPGSTRNAAYACFPSGTLVLCQDGLKDISDVEVGDLVWTHRHRWRPVTARQTKTDRLVRLTGQGHPEMFATGDHPFLSYSEKRGRVAFNRSANNRIVLASEWVPAEDLAGRLWASPRLPGGEENPFDISPEMAYLVGRWLGDGHLSRHNGSITISGHVDETDEIVDAFKAAGLDEPGVRVNGNAVQITKGSRSNADWLRLHFGEGAANKQLPGWSFHLPEKHRGQLLQGYLDADGYEGRYIEVTSVSKQLAIGMKLLAQSLDFNVNIYRHTPPKTKVISGRTVTQAPQWHIRLRPAAGDSRTALVERDGQILTRCKRVSATDIDTVVHDITVAEDHSFVADGLVVHNCQHFEWTARKIDFYDLAPWSKDSFRQRVGYWIGRTTSSSPSPAPKDWFDMATEAQLRKIVREEAPTLDEIALKVIQTLHPDHDGHPVRVGDLNPNTQTQVRLLVEATVEPVVERVLAKHGVIELDDSAG